jgi:hypothetical protein
MLLRTFVIQRKTTIWKVNARTAAHTKNAPNEPVGTQGMFPHTDVSSSTAKVVGSPTVHIQTPSTTKAHTGPPNSAKTIAAAPTSKVATEAKQAQVISLAITALLNIGFVSAFAL